MAMADTPPHDVDAFHASLAVAIATIEEAMFSAEAAIDDVQVARDSMLRLFGTAAATGAFNNPIADIYVAIRALADALGGLPPLPEDTDQTEEGAAASDEV
jgi:hypothetical protein